MKKITEENLNRIIKNSIKKVLKENYILSDLDELMEYMWLKPNVTKLNVDIFVDDGGSYLRNNHPLIVLVRNGYDRSIEEFIPFLVSDRPIVYNDNIEYNITYNDIFAVQDFIVNNLNGLISLANDKISQIEFYQAIRVPVYSIVENIQKLSKNMLYEMATLKSKDSNLPMDIWLDEGGTYIRHAPRIKFRASNEQRKTTEFSSMIISDVPEIVNFPKDSPIKKKDIDKLKEFVINNKDLLLKLANGEIDYITQFLPNMVI